jgi:hypothetical protein
MLDEARIRQSLLNLVGNAVKFTSAGRVRLSVRSEVAPSATSAAPPGATVATPATSAAPPGATITSPGASDNASLVILFEVEDTGIGIAPESQSHIFDAFMQQSTSIGRAYGGTGLGLAITKRLAMAMGGSLSVQSEYGRGSRFTLRLADVRMDRGIQSSRSPFSDADPSAALPDLVALARRAVESLRARRSQTALGEGDDEEDPAEVSQLTQRAASLGRGALAMSAVSDWITALDAAAEKASLAEVSAFASAARAALARFDVASLRSALMEFGH